MSKKLKKNFGSVGKGLKEGSDEKRRRPSVGSVTQSTKVSSITMEMLKEKEKDQFILAVVLSGKRPAYQVGGFYFRDTAVVTAKSDLMVVNMSSLCAKKEEISKCHLHFGVGCQTAVVTGKSVALALVFFCVFGFLKFAHPLSFLGIPGQQVSPKQISLCIERQTQSVCCAAFRALSSQTVKSLFTGTAQPPVDSAES